MFDAKRLLGEFIANQVQDKLRGGQGGSDQRRGSGFGGGRHGGSPLGDIARTLGGGGGGALAGGLASLVLGSKGRKLGGSVTGLGGMALVGSLAYQAFQNWQAGQAQPGPPPQADAGSFLGSAAGGWGATGVAQPSFLPPAGAGGLSAHAMPQDSRFAPEGEEAQQRLSRMLLRAMIAAAKADGHIDATEQAAIFGQIDRLDLRAEDKAFVIDELRAPLDVDAIARSAHTVEEAAEIYAASLLAISIDNAAERGYLALLAARLNLDKGLVAHLHATIADAAKPV